MMRYLFILLLLPFVAQGQTTYKILADSTRLGHINNTGNELILENDTRDSLGVIANIGNGRTQFKALRLQQLTDSTFRLLLGTTAQGQTITIKSTGGSAGATYTLTKNASKDSIVLTGSDGTRYAVLDSTGDGTLLLDTTNVSYYTVISTLNTPPISPAVGATYAIGNSPTGAWVGKAKHIAEWNGATWDFTAPVQGDYYYDQASGYTYQYRSGVWVRTSSIPVLVNGQSLSGGVLLGTNNSQSLTFETNNVRRSRIDSIGRFYVYNVPTSTDTFFVAYNSTGRFTKVGKSTLPNIYTTDGIIQDGTNRVVDVQGTLTIADTSIEGFDNFYSFIGIGDSIAFPNGTGGFNYQYSNGASQYSLFSNGNDKTAFSSVSASATGGGLGAVSLASDVNTNEAIGALYAYDTTSTDLLSWTYYQNPITDEYISMNLTEQGGFAIYPYLVGSGGSTYKQSNTFAVYDSSQNLAFQVSTAGTTSASNLSATTMKITGTNGSGHINLKHQASDATATGSSTALFADANGDLKYKNDNLYYTTLKTSGNTANREYRFPDSTGTVALTSNVVSVSSYGKNAGKDSTVLLLSNGTRFAAKDSTGGASSITSGTTTITGANNIGQILYDSSGFAKFSTGIRWDRQNGVFEIAGSGRSTNSLIAANNFTFSSLGSGLYNTSNIFTGLKGPALYNTIIKFGYSDPTDANAQIVFMRASNTDASIGFEGVDGAFATTQGQYRCHNTSASAIRSVTGTLIFYGNSGLSAGNVSTLTERFRIQNDGKIGIATAAPSAMLHLPAGTSTANTAPLKITTTSAALLTTPEAGAIEVLNDTLYYTGSSANRRQLTQSLYGSATLDFGSTNAQNSADLTIAIAGASDGDVVALGVPNGSTLTNSSFTAWVSATNTVTVRFNNYSSGSQDPASGTFKVRVIKN